MTSASYKNNPFSAFALEKKIEIYWLQFFSLFSEDYYGMKS